MSTGNAYGTGTRTVGTGLPVWVEILGKWQAGGNVTVLPAAGTVIPAGTPVELNTQAHTAKVLNFYRVHESINGSATTLKLTVLPGLPRLVAGKYIMVPPTTMAGTGTAITVGTVTAGTVYDSITIIANSLGALTAGDLLVEAAGTSTGQAYFALPNALTANDVYIDADTTFATVAGVYSGKVYAKRTPLMNSVVKANMPQIAFDDSY